jgi:hypothetical protein
MKTITTIHADAFSSDFYYVHTVDGYECRDHTVETASALSPELRAARQFALDWYVADLGPDWTLQGRIVIDRQRNAVLVDPEAEPPTYRDLLIGTATVRHISGATRIHTRTSEDMSQPLRDGFLALIAAREAALNA